MKSKIKRFATALAAFGVLAGTMALGGQLVTAQTSVDTTIVVESSACADTTPTSVAIASPINFTTAFSGTNAQHGFMAGPTYVPIALHVNECFEGGWQVTGTVTAFTSANGTIPASHFQVRGSGAGSNSVRYATGGALVPGAAGLPSSPQRAFTVAAGADRWTIDHTFMTGTSASRGSMLTHFQPSFYYIPTNTPAGAYSATLTLTFASTGP